MPGHLGPGETRVFVSPEEDPEMVMPTEPLGRSRSVIVNPVAQTQRLELPLQLDDNGAPIRKALHTARDEGAVGRPATWYMEHDLGLRHTTRRDRCHKKANCEMSAPVDSGNHLTRLETTVGLNLPGGPWDGGGYFQGLVIMERRYSG